MTKHSFFKGFTAVCLCLAVTWAAVSGCTDPSQTPARSDSPITNIVCTTGFVSDLVQAIVGTDVTVHTLMGPGVDPHLFAPSPKDVEKLATADAIVYSGLHLEAGLAGYLEKLSSRNPRVFALSEGVTSRDRLIEVAPGLYDPHFWNDLELWSESAAAFARKMAEWQPDQADIYHSRAAEYIARLRALLAASREQVAELSADQRLLITSHDAFAYLGRSLGLEVAAVQGISTDTEASVRQVEQLVSRIVGGQIPAVFAESSVSDKALRAIVDGCARQGHTLRLGGPLYSDALGPKGSPAEAFPQMYAYNVATIIGGLSRKP